MTDFPTNHSSLPLFISTFSRFGYHAAYRVYASTGLSTTTPVANEAVYMPVMLPWAYPVNRVWWLNGSTIASTNVDFGIYTPGGAQIYHTGSTAMSGTSSVQYVTPTPFVLPAGAYYFAWTCSNTSSRGYGIAATAALGSLTGCLQQTSALPLPSAATFAAYDATQPTAFCGITRTASGF